MLVHTVQRGGWRRAAALAGAIALGAILLTGQGMAPAQAVPTRPVITSPSDGWSTYGLSASVTITGTGAIGDYLAIYAEPPAPATAIVLCLTTVGSDGTWTCTNSLVPGTYDLQASTMDEIYSSPVSITVHAPVTFTIDSPEQFSTVNTATPTISGHANPGEVVTVMSAIGGSTLCTATTGDDTVWSCTVSPLANGFQSLPVYRGVWNEGNAIFTAAIPPAITSPISGSTFTEGTVSFSGTAPPSESIVVRTTEGYDLCAATTKLDGTWACDWIAGSADVGVHSVVAYSSSTLLQSDPITVTITGAPAVTPVIVSPESGATVSVGTLNFSGTAGADEPVSVWTTVAGLRAAELCSTTSDSAGDWQCSYDAGSSDVGSHTVVAYTTVESDPVDITIIAAPTYPLVVSSPESGSTVTTSTPTVSGTAAPGAEVSITTTEGGEPVCTTVADDSGAWSCTLSELPEGENTLFVTVDGDTTSLTITVLTSGGGGTGDGATPKTELATTGSDLSASVVALGVALVTVLTGGALLLIRQRRPFRVQE